MIEYLGVQKGWSIRMEVFKLTLNQMLLMAFLIVVGFILRKKKCMPDNAYVVLSKMETFVFSPALTFYTQMTKCTVQTFSENWVLILYGVALVLASVALAYPVSRLFVKKSDSAELEYQRNIYKYALTFGNYGFMGNFIILGVFGSDVFYRYSLFTLGISLVCTSWGLFVLIPKDRERSMWQNLKKGLMAPPIIAMVLGVALGLLNVKQYIPSFILEALDSAGDCQGPVAMVLAGLVIGGYSFKDLLTNGKVYVASLLRLVVIPAAMMLVLMSLGSP
jgi:predicted permease